jgi:hypothetical protein
MPQAESPVERALRSFAAAMLGEIAHELNNRLATMRETVGLLEDLARMGKTGAGGTARAHAALDDQVGRALNLVRALGGLGGALGSAAAGFDAGAAVTELLAMTERWARRHSLRVEREIADHLPRAAGDPALFLCLAHRLLVRCAGGGDAVSGISVRVEGAGAGIVVRLVPVGARDPGAAAPAAEEEETDRELAARLGAELIFGGDGAATIALAPAGEADGR